MSNPPQGHTLTVNGTSVLIEGQGDDTVVMVHGWPDTLALWDRTAAVLSLHLRCARFTLPGYEAGTPRHAVTLAQMVSHLAAIVDAVSPGRPVTLLLHDWGAVYGYQYVLQHPGRVARIVGLDIGDTASAEFRQSLGLKARAMAVGYQGFLALAWLLPASLGDRMTGWMARQLRAPAPREGMGAHMNYPYAAQFSGGFRSARPFEPPCPMLYLYGQRKPFMFHAPAWAERLAARPGSAVHGLRAGHWLMINQPEAFHRILCGWLGLPEPNI